MLLEGRGGCEFKESYLHKASQWLHHFRLRNDLHYHTTGRDLCKIPSSYNENLCMCVLNREKKKKKERLIRRKRVSSTLVFNASLTSIFDGGYYQFEAIVCSPIICNIP